MNTDENHNTKGIFFLDVVVKLSGIAASMALLLSITYDYGYFKSLDIPFFYVPSSISDHIRSGLIWFPPLFFGIAGATIFELITVRIEKGMSEDELILSSPDPEKTRKFREGPIKLLPWLAGIIILSYILMGDLFVYGLPMAFCLIWFRVAPWINNHPRIFQRHPKYLRTAIFWIPALIIFLYGKGYIDGKRLIYMNESSCSITLKDANNIQEPVILIRMLEEGILFKKPNDNKISYEKWDNIQRINKEVDHSLYQGILLKMLGVSQRIYSNDQK